MKRRFFSWGFLFLLCCLAVEGGEELLLPTLTEEQARRIGESVWRNECGKKKEGLLFWNPHEPFPSLGIGHFIWHPEGATSCFQESFPQLLRFLAKEGALLPLWLESIPSCPWKDRAHFLQMEQSLKKKELLDLLHSTLDLQVRFLVRRFHLSLPVLVKNAESPKREKLMQQIQRLLSVESGLYALIDYLNFKGEGLSPKERYQGKGWGVLQVLERMQGSVAGLTAVEEFVREAKHVLAERVAASPPERGEARWLPGWYNRLDTYILPP